MLFPSVDVNFDTPLKMFFTYILFIFILVYRFMSILFIIMRMSVYDCILLLKIVNITLDHKS